MKIAEPMIIDPQGRTDKECVPLRVRKLTPRESYRLMAFDDDDFDKAASVISNTQLYKTAGNSIVVDVLAAIFKEMIGDDSNGMQKDILYIPHR